MSQKAKISSGAKRERMVPLQVLERERQNFEDRSQKVVQVLQAKDREIASLRGQIQKLGGSDSTGKNETANVKIVELENTNRTLRAQVADQVEQIEVLIAEVANMRNNTTMDNNHVDPPPKDANDDLIDFLRAENEEFKSKLAVQSKKSTALENENENLRLKLEKTGHIQETAQKSVLLLEEEIASLKQVIATKSRQLEVVSRFPKPDTSTAGVECPKCQKLQDRSTELQAEIRKLELDFRRETLAKEELEQKLNESKKSGIANLQSTLLSDENKGMKPKNSLHVLRTSQLMQISHLEHVVVQQSQELVRLRTQLVHSGARERRTASEHHMEKRSLMNKVIDLEQVIRQNVDTWAVRNRHLKSTIRILSGKSDLHAKIAQLLEELRILKIEETESSLQLHHMAKKTAESEQSLRKALKHSNKLEVELEAFRASSVYADVQPVAQREHLQKLSLENERLRSLLGQQDDDKIRTKLTLHHRNLDQKDIVTTTTLSDERLEELKRDILECSLKQRQRAFSELEYQIRSLQTNVEEREQTLLNLEKRWFQTQDELNTDREKHAQDTFQLTVTYTRQLEKLSRRLDNQNREIQLLIRDRDKLQGELENSRAALKTVQDENQSRYANVKRLAENLEQQLVVSKASLSSDEIKRQALEKSISERDSQITILTETLNILQSTAVSKHSDVIDFNKNLPYSGNVVSQAKSSLNSGESDEAFNLLSGYIKTITFKLINSRVVESKLEQRCTALQQSYAELNARNNSIRLRCEALESKLMEREILLKEEKKLNNSLRELIEKAERRTSGAQNEVHNASVALIDAKSQLEAIATDRDAAVNQLIDLRRRFNDMIAEEMDRNFAKFSQTTVLAEIEKNANTFDDVVQELLMIAKSDTITKSYIEESETSNDVDGSKKLITLERLTNMMTKSESERVRISRDNVVLKKESVILKDVVQSLRKRLTGIQGEKLAWVREKAAIVQMHKRKLSQLENQRIAYFASFEDRFHACQERYVSASDKCAVLFAESYKYKRQRNGQKMQLENQHLSTSVLNREEKIPPYLENALSAKEYAPPALDTLTRKEVEELLLSERAARVDLIDRLDRIYNNTTQNCNKDLIVSEERNYINEPLLLPGSEDDSDSSTITIQRDFMIEIRSYEDKVQRLERELLSTRSRFEEMRMRAEEAEEREEDKMNSCRCNAVQNVSAVSHEKFNLDNGDEDVESLKRALLDTRRQLVELTCEYEAKLHQERASFSNSIPQSVPGEKHEDNISEMQKRIISQAEEIKHLSNKLASTNENSVDFRPILAEIGADVESEREITKASNSDTFSPINHTSVVGVEDKVGKNKRKKAGKKLRTERKEGKVKDETIGLLEHELEAHIVRINDVEMQLKESKEIERNLQARITEMIEHRESTVLAAQANYEEQIAKLQLELASWRAQLDSTDRDDLAELSLRTNQVKLYQKEAELKQMKEKNAQLNQLLGETLEANTQLREQLDNNSSKNVDTKSKEQETIEYQADEKRAVNTFEVEKEFYKSNALDDNNNAVVDVEEGPFKNLELHLERFFNSMKPQELKVAAQRLDGVLIRAASRINWQRQRKINPTSHTIEFRKSPDEYVYELERKLDSARKELERAKATEAENIARTAMLQSSVELAEKNSKSIQSRLSDFEPTLTAIKRQLVIAEKALELCRKENKQYKIDLEACSQENETYAKDLKTMGELKEEFEEKLIQVMDQYEQALLKLKGYEDESNVRDADHAEEISQLQMKIEDLSRQLTTANSTVKEDALNAELDKLRDQTKQKLDQAEKRAKRWKKMSEDLKTTLKDVKATWKNPKQVLRLTEELNNVKTERRKLREQIVRKAELLSSVQAKVKTERIDEEKSKEKLRKYESRIKSIEQDASNKEKLLRISRDRLEDLLKEKGRIDVECDSLRRQNRQLLRDKSILRGKLEKLEHSNSKKFQEIETERQQADENDRSKANMKIRSLQQKSNKFKREATKHKNALEVQNVVLVQKEECIADYQKRIQSCNVEIQTKEQRILSLVNEIETLKEGFSVDIKVAISSSLKTVVNGVIQSLCQMLDEYVVQKEQQIEIEHRDKIMNSSGEFDSVAKIINWSAGDVCDVLGVQLKSSDPELLKRFLAYREAIENQKSKLRSEIVGGNLHKHNESYVGETEATLTVLRSILSDTLSLLTKSS